MFLHQTLVSRIVSQALIILAVIVVAVPLVMIVKVSIQGQGLPNYVVILQDTPFLRFLINSAVISAVTLALVLAFSIAAAYCTVILRPRGSTVITVLVLAGLTMPAIALVVPVYSLVQSLGLFDTYWAVIIPLTALAVPFGFLVGGNYIRAIPVEVFEAATLDGAGTWRTFISVLLPLCRPILAVVAVFTFLAAWNEYLLPLLFLQDVDIKVVTQVPTYFQSQRLVDTPKVFAANVLISLPIIVFYLALQGTFRRGLSNGAIK
ncbi:carbohydrate ABC transporter permease [Herbiconiux sp. A18JL235]|uniref:Carbohydrate ABC transporter permease n=1 Tax=Herbiconiux sp. A18JL235 TaxID=3152363 RepID=A0AB39BHF9_9MICO